MSTLPRAAILAAFPFALVAQGPSPADRVHEVPPAIARDLFVPLHDETDPATGRVELWAGAGDWKASFHDGLRFLPRPGAERQDTPWHWRTVALTVAGEPVALGGAEQPSVVGPLRCEIDRGAIVETYDVRRDGVEQSFVLRAPLPSGDLVLTGAVSTGLTVEAGVGHRAFEFVAADGGAGVRYGAATVFDAAGRELALETAVAVGGDGPRIELRVPGTWLAGAAWPVVVDPLLSPVVLDGGSAPITDVELERDDRNNTRNVGVAFVRAWSSTDDDLYFELCNDDFGNVSSTVFSRISSASSRAPSLAFVNGANRWVLAWQDSQAGDTVHYHRHLGGSATFDGSSRSMQAPIVGGQRRPAVGGHRSTGAGTTALIVREIGDGVINQVWASLYDAVADQVTVTTLLRGGGTNPQVDAERPSVSKDAHGGSWLVAWQEMRTTIAPQVWRVAARRVDAAGNVATGVFESDRSGIEHAHAPIVDGRRGRWLVAFGTTPLGITVDQQGRGHALRLQRVDWEETSPAPGQMHASVRETFGSGAYYRACTVAHDVDTTSHWAVTWRADTPIGGWTTLAIVGHDAHRRNNDLLPNSAGSDAAVVYDDDNDRWLVAHRSETAGGMYDLVGRLCTYPMPAAPDTYGVGCGQAIVGNSGRFLAGSDQVAIHLLFANPNSFALLCLSLDDADFPLDGFGLPGCRLLVDNAGANWLGTVGTVTNAFGDASFRFALPSSLADCELYAQWIHADPARQNGLGFSDGLHAPVR